VLALVLVLGVGNSDGADAPPPELAPKLKLTGGAAVLAARVDGALLIAAGTPPKENPPKEASEAA
jgi:hypothetical protein